ncbi:MAG: arginine repressor [Lachnospiraceae bacterium]|jgi:transcriptional regulator of arginine metabolism|nr:arginine repressor [Lachnospiraceae bacterium]
MKSRRHGKILELIKKYDIETQEELSERLLAEGYPVTQATVSRDIRQLHLTKVSKGDGRQKYVSLAKSNSEMTEKYTRVFREGFLSMETAQNILVVKTVSGMAMAVAAALDHMDCHEIVGSIAGDDTIMCAVRSVEEAKALMGRLQKMIDLKE